MEREEEEEEVAEREGRKKQEFMGKKLRRVLMVGKKGGSCTPPPTWRLEFPSQDNNDNNKLNSHEPNIQEFITFPTATSSVSARKLCANLWQILPHLSHGTVVKMTRPAAADSDGDGGDGSVKISTHRNHQDERPEKPRHLLNVKPVTASSLRRHVRASPIRIHHKSKMNGLDQELVSSSSYTTSLEVVPYKPTFTPSNSLDFEGKIGESSYRLKTSTELLKLLNRVWSLEEERTASVTLIKGLKKELNSSQAQIKEMLKQRQKYKKEMDDLLKQNSENKRVRKNKEKERIKIVVQSARNELEDERSLRKHSESLHRKLSRQLVEITSFFSNAEEELEKERKARILLERLGNEFAKGIRDYEEKVRSLRNTSEKDETVKENSGCRILHIAEAWLDERLQMNSEEARNDLAENSIIDKLGPDIETFLQAKQSVELRNSGSIPPNHLKERCLRRHYLESFQLNDTVSAPRVCPDEEDSPYCNRKKLGVSKDTSAGEMNVSPHQQDEKGSIDHLQDLPLSFSPGKQTESLEISRAHDIPGKRLQVKEHKNKNLPCEGTTVQSKDKAQIKPRNQNQSLRNESDKSRNPRALKDVCERNLDEVCGSNTSPAMDNITQNKSLPAQGDRYCLQAPGREFSSVQSAYKGPSSPIKKWMSMSTPTRIENLDCPTNVTRELKEYTLKAKLIEARLDSHRRRRKASRASI